MHNEIMLDIETLGTKPGSAIVSIGACAFNFDTGEISPDIFLMNINPKSCVQAGLTMDADTVMWWMAQSDGARQSLISKDARNLDTVLKQFTDWIIKFRNGAPQAKIGIWGNDNTFDIVLTEHAFSAVNQLAPWSYWESRSVRTLVALGRRKGYDPKRDMPFVGTKHNAAMDAVHQAKYCIAIQNLLDNRQIPLDLG